MSVQSCATGRKLEGFHKVGTLEGQVGDHIAWHPVSQEKLEGFHYRELRAGSTGIVVVGFVHRPDLEVVAVAFGVAPEFPFPAFFRGH